MATLKNRLDVIEAKLIPKKFPALNLGLTAGTLEELREVVERCKEHNKPGGVMIHFFACYSGTPCEESVALLAGCRLEESPCD